MQQMEVSKWLKGITVALGIIGLIYFVIIKPEILREMIAIDAKSAFLFWPELITTWVMAFFCYGILYQFWKVCVEIGKDNSFSKENAKTFANISHLAILVAFLRFVELLVLALLHWVNPVMAMILLIIFLGFVVVAILAAALSHLILKAYEMKQENELTI